LGFLTSLFGKIFWNVVFGMFLWDVVVWDDFWNVVFGMFLWDDVEQETKQELMKRG